MTARLEDMLRSLLRRGLADGEVFVKRGRSRRVSISPAGEVSVASEEMGWAVRAGDRRASFFIAGTGELPGDLAFPEPSGGPLRLPEMEAAPPWSEPEDFAAPLAGEREALKLLSSLGRELAAELPGARLLHAALEDGASEGEIASSRGVRARFRNRIATLHLAAAGPGRPPASASQYLAAREPRRFHPSALARRLADRLAILATGAPPERDGGDLLLAPPVATRLLAVLLPLFTGPQAVARLGGLHGGRGGVASERLTLIDNGRLAGGSLEAPFDGEGVPSREVVLVEDGVFRQPLLAWWQADGAAPGVASGCSRRASWRDLPLPGPTHFYVRPDPRATVASLLGGVERGFYLIDATGAGRVDLAGDRFALPVCGFAVAGGRATAPVSRAWMCGSIGALLRGIVGVGRDLEFQPLAGMLGSPSLLVTGVELRAAPG
jgi:predicted Zn-dependent protease